VDTGTREFKPEVSFIIPCLNEEESLAHVINEIHERFSHSDLEYEVIVADNGSTDSSLDIATALGAEVANVLHRGYGEAILGGLKIARGEFVVMGDADGSYLFADSMPMIFELQRGADIVMGNRFKGGIAKDAMPWLHQYLGNPVLTAIGKILFKVPVGDFHCGLRAFRTEQVRELRLTSPGMEFASEMLVRAQKAGFRIVEVPVHLRKDLRTRAPHLRTWRDGWRHLRFLLSHSPDWVFLFPAMAAGAISLLIMFMAIRGPISSGSIELSYRTSLIAFAMAMVCCSASWAFILGRALVGPQRRALSYSTEFSAA